MKIILLIFTFLLSSSILHSQSPVSHVTGDNPNFLLKFSCKGYSAEDTGTVKPQPLQIPDDSSDVSNAGAQDDTSDIDISDTSKTDSQSDSLEDEEEDVDKPWTVMADVTFKNRQIRNGADVSRGKPVMNSSAGIMHELGFYLFTDVTEEVYKKLKFLSWSLDVGYSIDIWDWLSMDASFSRYYYKGSENDIFFDNEWLATLTAGFDFEPVSLDLSYDRYLGTDNLNYVTLLVKASFDIYDLSLVPLVSAMATFSEVEKVKLNKKTQQNEPKTKWEYGISSVSVSLKAEYELPWGLSVFAVPAYYFSPKQDLTKYKSQFVISAGIGYYLDF